MGKKSGKDTVTGAASGSDFDSVLDYLSTLQRYVAQFYFYDLETADTLPIESLSIHYSLTSAKLFVVSSIYQIEI